MSSIIQTGDIVWTRNGDPIRVKGKDPQTGQLYIDREYANVQKESQNGIKNGLSQDTRSAFQTVLSSAQNPDKKEEINFLFEKIKTLKGQNADPRLIKYLENELQFRIVRESYKPEDFAESSIVIGL